MGDEGDAFSCLAGVALCALLIGCDQATLMKKFTPQADESRAREYAELLRQRKFDQIEHDFNPSLVDSGFPGTLSKMAAFSPTDTPDSVKVVGAHTSHVQGLSRSAITLEYHFPSKWLLVEVISIL